MIGRGLIPTIFLLFLVILIAIAAFGETGTTTTSETVIFPHKRIVFNWISSATEGVVTDRTTEAYTGRISAFLTEPSPGDASPSVAYDVKLLNQFGSDVLDGAGMNRSQTATEIIYSSSQPFLPLVGDRLILSVSNCGAVNSGTAMFFVEP